MTPSVFKRQRAAIESDTTLVERVTDSGCRSIAVLGLHPGAGAGTVVAALAEGSVRAGRVPAVTTAADGPLDVDPTAWAGERTRLPAGAWIATARDALDPTPGAVEIVEEIDDDIVPGEFVVARVLQEGPVTIRGPEDAEAVEAVAARLMAAVDGPTFVTGRWERRGFSSPGRVDGTILAVGAGFSPTPERSAAAVEHHLEIARLPSCDDATRLCWQIAESKNETVFMGDAGRVLGSMLPDHGDAAREVESLDEGPVRAILHPSSLTDAFMKPLVRSEMRCDVVVSDTTRIHVAPVYYRAWLKSGGAFRVVTDSRVVAIATNPTSEVGEDAAADAFLRMVAGRAGDVPAHDVVLESGADRGRRGWRFWR